MTRATRLLTPEEIAVRAGQQMPPLCLPDRTSVFADRETRFRQLAAAHPMRDFLLFLAEVAGAQHAVLQHYPAVSLPDAAALAEAARLRAPPLPAERWPRDAVWRQELHRLLDQLLPRLQGGPAQTAVPAVQQLRECDASRLEQQADRLLGGVMLGLDLATAPLVAAGLQTYWTHLVLSMHGQDRPLNPTDDGAHCPCCGSRPTASVSRIGGESSGYRYLHCSLCSTQWHMVRIKCAHCQSTKGIAYQSLVPVSDEMAGGAAKAAVQAETCDACGHYLKIVHMERDPQVDPVADDLASVTLDLLVCETGRQRHGVNLMMLFGDPEPDPLPPLQRSS